MLISIEKLKSHTQTGSLVGDVHLRDRQVQIESVELRCVLKSQSVDRARWRCLYAFQIVRSVVFIVWWKEIPPVPESCEHHAPVAEFAAVLIRVPVCYRVTNICSSASIDCAGVARVHKTETDLHTFRELILLSLGRIVHTSFSDCWCSVDVN